MPDLRDLAGSRGLAGIRRQFGYKVSQIAEAMGYNSLGGTETTIRPMEDASYAMGRMLTK